MWLQHGKRCWLCREPLELVDSSVDHVVPEVLLQDANGLAQYLELYGLPSTFDVNGFENWLPAHGRCNQRKGAKRLGYVPEQRFIFETLMKKAELVRKTAQSIAKRGERGSILAKLLIALEGDAITIKDVEAALQGRYSRTGYSEHLSAKDDFIPLDTGYWIRRSDIAYEGPCTCARANCVGSIGKVHCLFSQHLSPWVIAKRLYWQCYDEAIACPRCTRIHRRGYVGRTGYCAQPYSNQEAQADEAGQ